MRRKEKKYRMIFAALLLIVTGLVIIAIGLGRYYISPIDVIKILLSKVIHIEPDWEAQAESVIFTLRLPRIFGALLVGAALSLSGAAYQACLKIRWWLLICWEYLQAPVWELLWQFLCSLGRRRSRLWLLQGELWQLQPPLLFLK